MSSLIQSTTPLAADGIFTSGPQTLTRATNITGSIFSDQDGTLVINQGGDGVNWDINITTSITGGTGYAIDVPVISQYFEVVFTNGSTAQNTFRLYVDARDPYGEFLTAATAPSPGGAYIVLFNNPSTGYQVVDRFDGTDGWNANQNAAVSNNKSGIYASFLVADATVTQETLIETTEHTAASF